jgi:hypothetical protein
VVLIGVAAYIVLARGPGPRASTPAVPNPSAAASQLIYFRHNGNDAHYGRLAKIRLGAGAAPEFIDSLS